MPKEYQKGVVVEEQFNANPREAIEDNFADVNAWTAGGTGSPTLTTDTTRPFYGANAMKISVPTWAQYESANAQRSFPYINQKFMNVEFALSLPQTTSQSRMTVQTLLQGNADSAANIANATFSWVPDDSASNAGLLTLDNLAGIKTLGNLLIGDHTNEKAYVVIAYKVNLITKKWVSFTFGGSTFEIDDFDLDTVESISDALNIGAINIQFATSHVTTGTLEAYIDRLKIFGSSV